MQQALIIFSRDKTPQVGRGFLFKKGQGNTGTFRVSQQVKPNVYEYM
jgi:hypothetical protein